VNEIPHSSHEFSKSKGRARVGEKRNQEKIFRIQFRERGNKPCDVSSSLDSHSPRAGRRQRRFHQRAQCGRRHQKQQQQHLHHVQGTKFSKKKITVAQGVKKLGVSAGGSPLQQLGGGWRHPSAGTRTLENKKKTLFDESARGECGCGECRRSSKTDLERRRRF